VPRRAERATAHPPFGLGGLGGFWTNDEVASFLDSLVADDAANLVAPKVDTVGTSRRGRPILGLLLGKQDGGLPTRPAVLLNALTHAREPQGMQSLLYFAHWLLSRYGADSEASYLLDHRRIYLCPVVNPDGYFVNESLYVANGSFGFWRKNCRDNDGDGFFDMPGDGVDLNRNYGYQWGFPNGGSSSNPASDVYRGPSAFSEPETQAQRTLVNTLQPKTGLSFHTYGDYYIHPWGYTAAAPPDSLDFYDWSFDATLGSHYQYGQAPRTLYAVAAGWYKNVKFFTVSDHIYQSAVIGFNAEWFDKLPPDLQKLLIEEGRVFEQASLPARNCDPPFRIQRPDHAPGRIAAGRATISRCPRRALPSPRR
jgi:hypothetical protein